MLPLANLVPTQPVQRVQPLPTPARMDEAVVTATLADIERIRGSAARRHAVERGLAKLSDPHQRDRLLLESGRIEVRAVLDKVNDLKSKAAKRRHLEDGLLALRGDAVDDALQAREIAVLEAAIRELDA